MINKIRALLDEKGRDVHSVSPSDTVASAAEQMSRHNCGAALVMEHDALAGIVTERDVLRKVVATHHDPNATPVSEVMTRDVVSVKPEDRVEDALALVDSKHIRHLPVVEGDKVVGVLSSGDLTRWAVRDRGAEADILAESMKREFPG